MLTRSAFDQEKYLVLMEEFVRKDVSKAEDNKPLLIEADDGLGKKALLVNWMSYHSERESTTEVCDR